MKYHFKQAVCIDKKNFKCGVHEVSEETENHPHFLKFVGAGFIHDVDAAAVISEKTPKERSEALLNKLIAGKKIKAPKSGKVAPIADQTSQSKKAVEEEEKEEDKDFFGHNEATTPAPTKKSKK